MEERQKIATSIDKDMEKMEPLYSTGSNVK
jgi:hypothetical protein